jgi:hypothetical protein
MTISLPTPRSARPLPKIDPFRDRAAYARLLTSIYHAEAAALTGFRLLTDPRYVEPSDLFDKAARKLIEDEEKHLADVAELLGRLGVSEIQPPSPAELELWEGWRRGDLFALPYKANIASLFCLFSEGLGFSILHTLHASTLDPAMKAALGRNLDDEEMHLRLSITVLERALKRDPDFLADFMVYLSGYALLARKPLREMRPVLEDLGFDFDEAVGSAVRFVFELLQIAITRAGQQAPVWLVADRVTRVLAERPEVARALHWSMFLPEPPLARRAVYLWGRWRASRRVFVSAPARPSDSLHPEQAS